MFSKCLIPFQIDVLGLGMQKLIKMQSSVSRSAPAAGGGRYLHGLLHSMDVGSGSALQEEWGVHRGGRDHLALQTSMENTVFVRNPNARSQPPGIQGWVDTPRLGVLA